VTEWTTMAPCSKKVDKYEVKVVTREQKPNCFHNFGH